MYDKHRQDQTFNRTQSYDLKSHYEWEPTKPLESYLDFLTRFGVWFFGPIFMLYIIFEVFSNVSIL